MAEAKRTKRVKEDTKTLEDLISEKRQQLVRERLEVPSLRERASCLEKEAEALRERWEARKRKDILLFASELIKEAEMRESMEREHSFEAKVVSYLRASYSQKEGVSQRSLLSSMESTQQGGVSLVDEFLTDIGKAPPKVVMAARDECPKCEEVGTPLLLCPSKSTMVCEKCGYTVVYTDATAACTAFDEVVDFGAYSYKRVNHYTMWLTLIQGKEAHRVPEETLFQVTKDLFKRQGVRKADEVTPKRVRDSLRKLRIKKAYDHVAQIAARISGIPATTLSPQVEEQLKNMFLKMQPAFHKHAPKTRSNFLSYGYVLYRCFQILGLHDMTEGISLLKSREKLEANDAIFKKMCVDLGWKVPELPPP